MNSKQKAILLVFLPFVSFLMLTNWLQTVSAIPAQTHHAILDSIITVTTSTDELNTNGQCSLREAITNANNDDQSGSTDCAAGNGSDTISLSNSIYTLTLLGENEDNNQTGDLDISSDIVFQGVTSATTIIQAGTTITNSIDRVFQITISNTVFSVTFDSLTIRHGKSYGILNYSGGNLNIINSAILSNSYEGNGGIYSTEVLNIVDSNLSFNEGPAVQNTGMLYMNNTVVSNNNGGAGAGLFNSGTTIINNSDFFNNSGGGIHNRGPITITASHIYNNYNYSFNGGGGLATGWSANAYAYVEGSQIHNNYSFGAGGGIYNNTKIMVVNTAIYSNTAATSSGGGIASGGPSIIANSTITHNNALAGGGIAAGGHLKISNSLVSHNGSQQDGGGIRASGIAVTVENSIITDNHAGYNGGGIINSGGFILDNVNISHNETDNGGGLYNSASITITNSIVSYNVANIVGGIVNEGGENLVLLNESTVSHNFGVEVGGIYNHGYFLSPATFTINNSTISDNISNVVGGIYNDGSGGLLIGGIATLTMNNSTLSNNSADNIGGIDNHAGTLILTHSTIAENSANTIGGIYSHNSFVSAHFTLNSSIIANPTSSGDCINVDGSVTSSYSLIADSNNTCGLIDGIDNNLIGHDPLLLPLADNGGNTWTHALLPTSPAVDHVSVSSNGCGTIIVTDQRGVTRPQDGDGDGTLSCDIGAFEIESLAIYKTGPAAVATGQPITYFLNISNNSDIALTGVIITDAIPAGATYLGGGTQVGSIVSWTVPNLIAGETITRQFAVLATSTITNSDYRVTVSEGYNAIGYVPVVTVIQEPVSGLAAINDSPTIIGSNTTLTATITQGEDVTYTWNFGDGQGASGAVVEHNYPAIGVYTAVVTASNSVSTATATVTVTISSEFTFTIYLPIIRKPEM